MAVDSEHAVDILSKIFENGIKPDMITLIAGVGGRRIAIHRVFLTANSEYFTVSLGPNFSKSNETDFILDETDGPTLKAVVDFCYTGRIKLTEENVLKYLTIASGVEMCLLEEKCFRLLTDKLDRKTAVTTLVIADKFNGRVPRQKAYDFICELFDEISPSHIDGLDSRLLAEILKSDAVRAEEQYVLERVLSWFRKDQDDRGQHMAELMKLVRLPLIPTKNLCGDTMQMIYGEVGCLEYLGAECIRRIGNSTPNAGSRRRRSIYCLLMQHLGLNGAEHSGVKIERDISALNEFETVGEIRLGRRRFYEAILHENKLYVLGGQIGSVAQKSVSVFDLITGEKRVLPEMESARSDFASILIGKFIYVFGGSDARNGQLASCERFDIEAEIWQTLMPMRIARSSAVEAVLNGCIYVAGGYDFAIQGSVSDVVELFDPQNDEWITLTPMNDARVEFTICYSKEYLYAMGMSDTTSIERYDPLTSPWMIGAFESCKNIASSMVSDDKIHAIKKNGEFGEIEIGENSGWSFVPIAKLKFKAKYGKPHFLLCKSLQLTDGN